MANPLDKLRETIDQIRENEQNPEKMKLKEYIGYALGRLCYGSISKMSSDYLNQFYLAKGIKPGVSGGLLFAQKLYDSVNDPLVATYIDSRKNTKNGRFKPFLAKLVPVLAVTSIAMFAAPDFGNITALMAWCFMTYAIWETINTFSGISFEAISTVMSADPQERTLYTTIGNLGQTLAGLVPGVIPVAFDLCTKTRENGGLGMSQANFYTMCAVVFAVIGGVAGMFTKNLQERIAPPKKNEHFWESFVLFFKNKNLLLLWSTEVPQLISSAAAPANAQFYIHSMGGYGYQALQWIIAGIPHALAQVLAPFFIKRFRPSRIVMYCTVAQGLLFLVMYPVVKAVGYDTPWGIFFVMLLSSVGWVPMGIAGIAKNILKMNTFDYTAAQTGKRAEATSLMMYNMMSKWLWAVAALIGGFALAYIGFQEDINGVMQVQTQATCDGLFFIFATFPAIGNILGGLPMMFFKLEGKEFERRMAELNERNKLEQEIEAEVAIDN